LPVFYRVYQLNSQTGEYKFNIENEVYEEIKLSDRFHGVNKIAHDIQINSNINQSAGARILHLQVSTIKKAGNKIFRLKSFQLKQLPVETSGLLKKANTIKNVHPWKANSVLKQGKWVKIGVSGKRIIKIPYSKLISLGFTDPSKVNVFGSGGVILSEDPGEIEYDDLEQCAVWHDKNNGADCLFFYSPGTTEWNYNVSDSIFTHRLDDYSPKGYFFLTNNVGTTKTAELLPVIQQPATHSVVVADSYQLFESELENVLPLGSGKQWFGEKFKNSSVKSIDFDLTDIDITQPIKVRINAISRSYSKSEMKLQLNQKDLGVLNFSQVNTGSQTSNFADEKAGIFKSLSTGNQVKITLKYFAGSNNNSTDENALAWLDFLEINYRRKLKFGNEALFFRDSRTIGTAKTVAFSIENAAAGCRVFDITSVNNAKEIPLQISGNVAVAKRPGSELFEYVAFNPNGIYTEPEYMGEVAIQNLHAISTPEFIIITHPNFISSANRLADFHRSYDGMSVEVVTADQVYNEFSSGAKSATGIRNFVKMLYDRGDKLKYVLLFGDGSFDNRGIRPETKNFIPTYQSENSLVPVASFVSDDYFAILDAGESVYNGAEDVGIGRIPCSTTYEAELVINKIENYYKPEALGNWRNIVCLIGDDEDGSLHMSDSEKLANQINTSHNEFIIDRIYLDAYLQQVTAGEEKYPDVTDAINTRVKEGVLILNYVGHANERFMADEHVLDISNVNSWSNSQNLPIFVTATCEFSRYDADDMSIGEYVLFNPVGGGIGLFSTTRLVFAYSN